MSCVGASTTRLHVWQGRVHNWGLWPWCESAGGASACAAFYINVSGGVQLEPCAGECVCVGAAVQSERHPSSNANVFRMRAAMILIIMVVHARCKPPLQTQTRTQERQATPPARPLLAAHT